ncbi:MAG: hypothetical protein OER88_00385 [Planctomycetota bacterium]|nr:hypothetical protein [Planctomycetota bacterium]
MAKNETHFEFADRGATSVYKFRFDADGPIYVWFEVEGGGGSLHTTDRPGPYSIDHDLGPADHDHLDGLLAANETTKEQWVRDLMAQFGERIAWAYP